MTRTDRSTRPGGRRPGAWGRGGFTLIEVIAVIVIIGVLSVFVYSSVGLGDPSAAARASEIRSQLRFVQLRAMKSGATYCGMRCDGTNYWAFTGADPASTASRIPLPGESALQVPLAGKSMTMSSFTVYFDGFGIPYSGSTPVKLAAAQAIVLTAGGQSTTLSLAPETGFIP